MDRSIQLIRLELDGRWSAEDLGEVMITVSDLYNLRLFLEYLHEDHLEWKRFYDELIFFPPFSHYWKRRLRFLGPLAWPTFAGGVLPIIDEAHLLRLSRLLEPEERLEVRRVNYASPGFTDLAGIGTVVGHIKDFILKLIERRDSRRQRELSDERTALENDKLRMQNAREFISLAKELGYSETDLRRLMLHVDGKQDQLIRLIQQQKLRGVSVLAKEGSAPDEKQ